MIEGTATEEDIRDLTTGNNSMCSCHVVLAAND